MNDRKYDQELDCTGLNCPLPILKTKKMMDTMNPGEMLKMTATDPGSINDIKAWTNRTGNELIDSAKNDDEYIFYIRKV